MSIVSWKPGLSIVQDPDAVRDYALDFTKFLEGETLASVDITAAVCTAVQQGALGAASIKIRVSAVAEGASVRLHLTTSSGQEDDRTVLFTPQEM